VIQTRTNKAVRKRKFQPELDEILKNASLEQLHEVATDLRPHAFHFSGHGARAGRSPEG